MTSPDDAAYGINQVHLTVTLPSASADLGKPLEVEDWATLDWQPGLVAMIQGRIVFRPDGGDVIHCIGIGQVMTSPPPVDDSNAVLLKLADAARAWWSEPVGNQRKWLARQLGLAVAHYVEVTNGRSRG